MNLKKYRSSFLCSFVGTKEWASNLQNFVANRKYQTLHYLTLESLFQDLVDNPPHFVCWHVDHFNEATLKSWMDRFKDELPETRVVLVVQDVKPQYVLGLDFANVYSVIQIENANSSQILKEIDHAAENIVYFYLNEQLTDRLKELESSHLQGSEPAQESDQVVESGPTVEEPVINLSAQRYFDFQNELFEMNSAHSSIETFLSHVEPSFGEGCGALYFKFNSPRKTLIAAYGLGVDPALIEGIGLNLDKVDPEFKRSQAGEIHLRESFKSLLRDVFKVQMFHCHYLTVNSEVIGVFTSWGVEADSESQAFIESGFELLRSHCQSLDIQKRLHTVDSADESRHALKKHLFFQKMNEEVARARRTSLPLAFVLMSVDNFKEIEEKSDSAEVNLFFRTLAQIVDKHSRVNDILGRVSRSEFGLLLPHTSVRGGVVKAERLRRMIESANFRKVLAFDSPVTISLSVSEYPSNCRDSDELFQSADQVLFDQDRFVANKVVVARPPEGFIADFLVQEVKDSRLVK